MIKLFLTDIDGVWTDGSMYYSTSGEELKKFNTYDSAGVLFAKLMGINVGIITGENNVTVSNRANKLGISICHLGIKDKVAVAESCMAELNIGWEDVAYIGDDINDIELLRKAGLSACPAQAPNYIKKEVMWVLEKRGGEGVFREFVERYLDRYNLVGEALDRYHKSKNYKQ